jgi:hypothetical protein
MTGETAIGENRANVAIELHGGSQGKGGDQNDRKTAVHTQADGDSICPW